MAAKTSKSKEKARPAKGVVGFFKSIVEGPKPTVKVAKRKPSKPKAPARAKEKPAPKDKKTKGKANGKTVAPPAPPVPMKKKPPSITITRPEATRPPVVLPPPRPLEAPIGAPSILIPKGGIPIASLTPIFRWMYVGGATRYEVEWSHDAHFGRGHSTSLISMQTAVTLEASNALKPSTNYKWRVRGGNDAGWGPWSPPESFKSPEKPG